MPKRPSVGEGFPPLPQRTGRYSISWRSAEKTEAQRRSATSWRPRRPQRGWCHTSALALLAPSWQQHQSLKGGLTERRRGSANLAHRCQPWARATQTHPSSVRRWEPPFLFLSCPGTPHTCTCPATPGEAGLPPAVCTCSSASRSRPPPPSSCLPGGSHSLHTPKTVPHGGVLVPKLEGKHASTVKLLKAAAHE